MDKDFLLTSKTAKKLYHKYAETLPIIDYHCHIPPNEIAEDKKYSDITELWLSADHYKWRLMRANGSLEENITGTANSFLKFNAFAAMLPKAIGNPMYHWTHLELKRYFDFDGTLMSANAKDVYNLCNKKLSEMSAKSIIKKSNVACIVTTDDPIDNLSSHEAFTNNEDSFKVLPGWRPDKAIHIDAPGFAEYINKLSLASGIEIDSFETLISALKLRLQFFIQHGCKATDHGLFHLPRPFDPNINPDYVFKAALSGNPISQNETESYKTSLMLALAREYSKNSLVMQIHYGPVRNVNTAMSAKLGADSGYDIEGDCGIASDLSTFLNELEKTNELPKTVIYSSNQNDIYMLSSAINAFQGEGIAGKLQLGAPWWFNDTKDGMIRHLHALAEQGLLGNFIGMLTDSRSLLSYTRHEYFRRILCDVIGKWVESGEYPNNIELCGKLVQDICYYNCKRYFNL